MFTRTWIRRLRRFAQFPVRRPVRERYRPRIDSLEDRCLFSVGITEFTIPTRNSAPEGITAGPDGNLWFTEGEFDANKIGRITPSGVFTEFQLPGSWTGPLAITAGPDGNLWFTAAQTIPSNPGFV